MMHLNPSGGSLLQRIDLALWYNVGETMHPLTEINGRIKLGFIFLRLHNANGVLEMLMPQMSTSWGNANALKNILDTLLGGTDLERVLEPWETSALSLAAARFETVIKAELGIQSCYHVSPKGGYDVNLLTLDASKLFPADLSTLVPLAIYDMEQAGKCLAFEVPTAAAFHLHRLNEAVLRTYWDVFTNKAEHPKTKNMGDYLKLLKRRKKKEAKLLAILQQIKDLHRNPSLHPDANLTVDEAIELYGIIGSAVSRMLVTIRKG